MILLCSECHWSTVLEEDKVAAAGGPTAFKCEVCQNPLNTMEVAFGVDLASGSEAADHMGEDHLTATVKQDVLARPSKGTLDLRSPPGQVVIGGDSFFDQESTRRSVNAVDDAFNTFGDPSPDATQLNAQPLRPPSTLKAPPPLPPPTKSSKGAIGLAVGCAIVAGALLLIGGVAFGLYFILTPEDAKGPVAEGDGPDAGGAADEPPARPPLAERLTDLTQSHSSTSVPAIALPEELPNDGEPILLTPNGVVFGGEMVATVSLDRVDPGVRPNEDSPLILPLATAIDAIFKVRNKDEVEADANPRRAIILGDGTVPYPVAHAALYTAWSRGAHLVLATTNPSNPNAYVTIEIIADGWPAPVAAGAPDDLPSENPALTPDPAAKTMVVQIHSKGFVLAAPGQSLDEGKQIEKSTVFPIPRLKEEIRQLRIDRPEINAVLIQPSARTSLFTILQTISAAVEPVEDLKPLREVRLGPPGNP